MKDDFIIRDATLEFDLPPDRIAQEPLVDRDQARLLVLDRTTGHLSHRRFFHLKELLKPGDVLVLNQAKVSKAKLVGKKSTGGRVEVLLIGPGTQPHHWRALVRPQLKVGASFQLGDQGQVVLVERTQTGENILRFEGCEAPALMEQTGQIPLPPYIKRQFEDPRSERDKKEYQTVYAEQEGSLAAPTAGLHFTRDLLNDLDNQGLEIVPLLLHVGWGTFRPISSTVDQHEMLAESYEISQASIEKLIQAKQNQKRIIAVGTTVTRVLESLPEDVTPTEKKGETNIFIKPGHSFRWLSGLITNFHVPRSTPVALTAAFAGMENLEKAYGEAIKEEYRFYSYGDAMFIH